MLEEAYEKACEGRREDEGDWGKANTGEVKQSSRAALTGVTGEDMARVAVGVPVEVGVGTNVEKEEIDSLAEDIEPR